MVAAARIRPDVEDADQHVFLRDVPWWQYEAILAFRGDRATPRIAYLDGVLELMSPSRSHEGIKTTIARLLEIYAYETGLTIHGYGSMTMREAPKAAGVEPDECYVIGADKEQPDLAIEVIWTSRGIDKREIYRRLGVRELWVWEDERIELLALRNGRYERIEKSEVLPALDLELLSTFVRHPSQGEAVAAYGAKLRQQR
jgi:Uma2 family endonuclease